METSNGNNIVHFSDSLTEGPYEPGGDGAGQEVLVEQSIDAAASLIRAWHEEQDCSATELARQIFDLASARFVSGFTIHYLGDQLDDEDETACETDGKEW